MTKQGLQFWCCIYSGFSYMKNSSIPLVYQYTHYMFIAYIKGTHSDDQPLPHILTYHSLQSTITVPYCHQVTIFPLGTKTDEATNSTSVNFWEIMIYQLPIFLEGWYAWHLFFSILCALVSSSHTVHQQLFSTLCTLNLPKILFLAKSWLILSSQNTWASH